jgi:molybdopterin-guanine dinucleotide biosynthesis protein A
VILLVGRVDMRAPPPGVRLVPDRIPDSGPLGGLDAALAAERDEIRVLPACDMPIATSALLAYLVAEAQHADIVVPRTKRGYYPLCAVYTRTCRNTVAGRLDRRDFTMTGLFEDMRVRVMDSSDLERFSNTDRLLANVNTPVEFDELEALLGHKL